MKRIKSVGAKDILLNTTYIHNVNIKAGRWTKQERLAFIKGLFFK